MAPDRNKGVVPIREGSIELSLELDRLDLRYESLRVLAPERDRRLIASLSEVGQLVPIAVLSPEAEGHHIVVDGYRRVRALKRLRQDVVRATRWELPELEALLLCRSLRKGGTETSLELAWLLDELRRRFGLTLEELARQFDKSPSWVSRRLALVRELPPGVQESIRRGEIGSHAAEKYLVPLARANLDHCERLARAIAGARVSSRDVGHLYSAWRDAGSAARDRLVADPILFLRTQRALAQVADVGPGPREGLLRDISIIAATSRRVGRRLADGLGGLLAQRDLDEVCSGLRVASAQIERALEHLATSPGATDARPHDPCRDPGTLSTGQVDPPHRP